MGKITMDQAKELEIKKEDLLVKIKNFSMEIMSERDTLLEQIHSLKHEVEDKEFKERISDYAEEDIYNMDKILCAGEQCNLEELKKKIKLLYRGYSLNPYCDKNKTEKAISLLDELEIVVTDLDSFYNDEVERAYKNFEMAKNALLIAKDRRLEYRREVLQANSDLKEAARYDKVGGNELRKYGANEISSGVIFGHANCGIDGKSIISITKTAIENERNSFKKMKEVKIERRLPFVESTYMGGEHFAMFGNYSGVPENVGLPSGNPLKSFIGGLFK